MNSVRNVLAVVDGSPQDETIVSIACDLTRHSRGSVWLLYVIDVPRRMPVDAEIPEETARGEQILQRMERLGKQLKCRVEGDLLQAREIGAAIVREAIDRNADSIIIGIPYMERYGSPTLGDTAPYLMRYSPCAVIVHRGPQPPPETAP